jgi:hypothetical protein
MKEKTMRPTATAIETPEIATEQTAPTAPTAPPAQPAQKLHVIIRRAGHTVLGFLNAWTAERTGIDPAYLGVLLLASFELGVHRMLGK